MKKAPRAVRYAAKERCDRQDRHLERVKLMARAADLARELTSLQVQLGSAHERSPLQTVVMLLLGAGARVRVVPPKDGVNTAVYVYATTRALGCAVFAFGNDGQLLSVTGDSNGTVVNEG